MARQLPRQSILRASAPEARSSLNGSDRIPSLIGGANLTGVVVNERSALTLTAAFACINVLSTDVAFFPLLVKQRLAGGGSVERPDHPADQLLRLTPDDETTTMRARQAWMGHCLGWGNGYQLVERDRLFGRPVAIRRLDPQRTESRRRKADNRLYYADEDTTYLASDVLHLAGLGFDGLRGYSPVRLARQAIALGLAAEASGAAVFGNGLNHRGILKTPNVLSEQAWENLRRRMEQTHLGVENAHRFLLLEEGVQFDGTSMSLVDAEYLAVRAFQVIEVCRLYRVPPHKVQDYSQAGSAYRALEEANTDYVNTTLAPWCEQIEQVACMKLLTPDERAAGFYVEHTLAGLLKGDSRTRGEYYARLRDLGVLTPNQIARLEGLNPIGDQLGDVRLVPKSLQTLESIVAAPAPKSGKKGSANG